MKQSILFILFLSLIATALKSQNKWAVGPTVLTGFSGEQQQNKETYDYSSETYTSKTINKVQPSFGAGFSAERYFGKRWGINLGVQYNYIQRYDFFENDTRSRRGLFSTPYYSSSAKRLIAHQLQAPVQARFYFGKQGKTRPFLSAGGLFTYTLSAKMKSEYISSSSGITNYSSNDSQYELDKEWTPMKRYKKSFFFGFGIDFKVFSIEINRIQAVLVENNAYNNTYIGYDCLCYTLKRKTNSTLMTIKYKL